MFLNCFLTTLNYNQPFMQHRLLLTIVGAGLLALPATAQDAKLLARANSMAAKVEPKVIEWRRDFHEHPELGNREVKTASKIAAELKRLGI